MLLDPSHLGYELYDYNSNQWTCNGGTPPHTSPQNVAQGYHTNEIGAAVMMYNGYVLQFGADDTNPSTALYKVGGDWKAGPVPPFASPPNDSLHLIQTDGPAVLEPNGKVLALMSPWLCNQHPDCMGSCDPTLQCGAPGPCDAVEYTPSSDGSGIGIFNLQTKPNMCTIGNSSLPGHMLLLPNGQIMLAYYATELELFTPDLNLSDWPKVAPHIISTGPLTLKKGQPTAIIGTQFNGLSQANMYGDDFQDATNFPIAQLSTGSDCQHLLPVALVPTGNDFGNPISNPPNSIQPNNETGTYVTVPQSQNTGSYWLSVITNGIPSDNCIWVTVVP